jgi:DNA adenine methylase
MTLYRPIAIALQKNRAAEMPQTLVIARDMPVRQRRFPKRVTLTLSPLSAAVRVTRLGRYRFISHFPEHRTYVEPFGGAASVLLHKPRSYAEIYNDLAGEIVNVFRVMRNNPEGLRKRLLLTPFARTEYFGAYKPSRDLVEGAAHTIIKSFMGYGSDSIFRASGFRANSNRSGTAPAHDWANFPKTIDFFIQRLSGVVIEERPATEVMLAHDSPTTLYYVDPPYLHSTRSSRKAYLHEMTDDDHRKLARVLHELSGMVVVSGYPSQLYEELYAGWRRVERQALADGARKRVAVLWMNF